MKNALLWSLLACIGIAGTLTSPPPASAFDFFSDDRANQSDAELGLNLVGGLRIPAPSLHYFLEGRYTASSVSQFGLLGGITFHGWHLR